MQEIKLTVITLNKCDFIVCTKTVETDVDQGWDRNTGDKIEAFPVYASNSEIGCLVKCYKGDDFGKKFEDVLRKLPRFG